MFYKLNNRTKGGINMVTKQNPYISTDDNGINKNLNSFDWMCLSTDTKPTEGVNINSLLLELDTGKGYYFDGIDWQPIGEG